ncbi:MAG: DoxX family membrane protein [Planctomycetota bacterium]
MSDEQQSGWLRRVLHGGGLSLGFLGDAGVLLLRLYAGVSISRAGLDKLPTTTWFAGDVADLGFPLPQLFAFLAAFSEFAGGLLLVVGLFTRPAALLLTLTFLVAVFGSHAEVPLFVVHVANQYLWMFVALLGVGAGGWSLDRLLLQERPLGERGRLRLLDTLGVALFGGLLAFGAYREMLYAPPAPEAATDSLDDIQSVGVPGSFNGWNLTATPMTRSEDGVWRAEVEIAEVGPIEFKFAANETWNLNLGAAEGAESGFPLHGTGTTNLEGAPENIQAYIPAAGRYVFTLDVAERAYSLKAGPE